MIAALCRVILGSLWLPVTLSLLSFAYFGYRGTPYVLVILSAAFFTCYELWAMRPSFHYAFGAHNPPSPWWHKPTQIAAIVLILFGAFLGAGSAVYFLVQHVSN